jgi:hypothetical protein
MHKIVDFIMNDPLFVIILLAAGYVGWKMRRR